MGSSNGNLEPRDRGTPTAIALKGTSSQVSGIVVIQDTVLVIHEMDTVIWVYHPALKEPHKVVVPNMKSSSSYGSLQVIPREEEHCPLGSAPCERVESTSLTSADVDSTHSRSYLPGGTHRAHILVADWLGSCLHIVGLSDLWEVTNHREVSLPYSPLSISITSTRLYIRVGGLTTLECDFDGTVRHTRKVSQAKMTPTCILKLPGDDGGYAASLTNSNTLVWFDEGGGVLQEVTHEALKYPRHLILDNTGHILVGCQCSVVLFSRDGSYLRTVAKEEEGLLFPSTLALTPRGHLCVGHGTLSQYSLCIMRYNSSESRKQ